MLTAFTIPTIGQGVVCSEGVHKIREDLLCIYKVTIDAPDGLNFPLADILTEVIWLGRNLYRVHNYRRRLVLIASRHGVYFTTETTPNQVHHKFTDGTASVCLSLTYRPRGRPTERKWSEDGEEMECRGVKMEKAPPLGKP